MLCNVSLVPHHIGYAVQNIEKACAVFSALGYKEDGPVTEDYSRNLYIHFLSHTGYRIELLAVIDAAKPSPIDFLFKDKGSGKGKPYHVCYISKDLEQDVELLRQQKFVVIQPSAEAPAIEGKNVVFLFHREIGILELLEE